MDGLIAPASNSAAKVPLPSKLESTRHALTAQQVSELGHVAAAWVSFAAHWVGSGNSKSPAPFLLSGSALRPTTMPSNASAMSVVRPSRSVAL